MKTKLLPRITEVMLYLLAAFVLFCAVTLYIPGSGWDQIISQYCEADANPVALRVFLTVAAAFAFSAVCPFGYARKERMISMPAVCTAQPINSA